MDIVASPTECTTPFPALLVHSVWLYSSGPVGFVLPFPVFLGFCTQVHMLRWIRGQSIQVWQQYTSGKKGFSPGQVKGAGGVTPLVAVEAETNMENSILWRHPKEEDVGGPWFISVGAWRAWIALANVGQLKWSLLPKNLSSSYKLNFCLQWQMDKSKKQITKGERKGRKLVSVFACLSHMSHPQTPTPFYHPGFLAINYLMKGNVQNKTWA